MFCGKCGSEVGEDSQYCMNCGAPVGGHVTSEPEKKTKKEPKPAPKTREEREKQGKLWQLAFCGIVLILVVVLGIRYFVGKFAATEEAQRPSASAEYQAMLDQYGFEDVSVFSPEEDTASFVRTYTASGGLNINCKLQKAEYVFDGSSVKSSAVYYYYQDTLSQSARDALKKSAGPGTGVNEWLLFDGYVVAVNYNQAPFYQSGISDWQALRNRLISFGWIER